MARTRDGMFGRFTGPVMTQVCALTPDFADPKLEANKFYRKMKRSAWFSRRVQAAIESGRDDLVDKLPSGVEFSKSTYRCTYQATIGELVLGGQLRMNSLELVHVLAHYLQPSGSTWHGGEFGSTFLDLVERTHGADTKRAVKDIMLANKIKTSVRSTGTREKQSERYYERKVKKAPEGLVKILQEMREMREE